MDYDNQCTIYGLENRLGEVDDNIYNLDFEEFCEITFLDKRLGKDMANVIYNMVNYERKVYEIQKHGREYDISLINRIPLFSTCRQMSVWSRVLSNDQMLVQSYDRRYSAGFPDYPNRIVILKDIKDRRRYREILRKIRKERRRMNEIEIGIRSLKETLKAMEESD